MRWEVALWELFDYIYIYIYIYIYLSQNGLAVIKHICRAGLKQEPILFNSHLVTDPDFIAHFLNICTLLPRLKCLRWPYWSEKLTFKLQRTASGLQEQLSTTGRYRAQGGLAATEPFVVSSRNAPPPSPLVSGKELCVTTLKPAV